MREKSKSSSIWNYLYDLFLLLFPIAPEFTLLAGRVSYEWIVVFTALFFLILKGKVKKKILRLLVIPFLLYVIMYGAHNEWGSILTIIIDCFIPIIIVFSECSSIDKIEKSLKILLIGGAIECIEAIIEFISGLNLFSLIQTVDENNPMGAKILSYRYGFVRSEGSLGQSIPFAMYLLFINFIAILFIVNAEKKNEKPKRWIVLIYFISLIANVLAGSRMVLILGVITQIFFFSSLKPKRKIVIILIGLLIIPFLLLTTTENGQSGSSMINDAWFSILGLFNSKYYNNISDGGQNLTYRLYLFTVLKPYIEKNLLLGMGARERNNFTFDIVTSRTSWNAYSIDNNYLSYLLTYGFVGLFADIYLIIVCIFVSIRKLRSNNFIYKYSLLFSILYAIDLIAVFQMGEKRIFFLLTGIFLAYSYLDKKQKTIGGSQLEKQL